MFIFWCFNVDSSMKTSSFLPKLVAQLVRLILSSHQNTDVFRMLLNSFSHITDTKRNIATKDLEICYKKCTVHRYSGKSETTNCTTATVQQLYTNFIGCLRSTFEMEHDLFSTDYCKLLFMNHYNICQTMIPSTKIFIKEYCMEIQLNITEISM